MQATQEQVTKINFENKVAILDLPTLKQTVEFTDTRGNFPKQRPVNHADFLERIMEKADNKKVLASSPIIYADESYTNQIRWKGDKSECPIDQYLFQRLVAKIDLNLGSTDMNMAIAVSYNERGLSVAYGPNVHACGNQNIFGNNIVYTYGDKKMPFEKILEVLEHWFNTMEPRWHQDWDTIKTLGTIKMGSDQKYQAIGEMIDLAVLNNMGKGGNHMLNQSQVADFIRATHEKYPTFWSTDGTAWDFLQAGTEVLKPQKSDFILLNDTINKFSNFVLQRSGIDYDVNKFSLN
jgi:hypothetical protein